MDMEKKYYLGFDAGTQSVKVAVYSEDMECVAMDTAKTTLYYPHPGWVQMDVDEYYRLIKQCMASCSRQLEEKGISPAAVRAIMGDGIICGICLASAAVIQQIGIAESGAGKGGFITSLYIIIVPFLSVVFGKKVEKKTWIAGIVAIAGMYLLCIGDSSGFSRGDIFLLICALFFSFHIMAIDSVGKNVDGGGAGLCRSA